MEKGKEFGQVLELVRATLGLQYSYSSYQCSPGCLDYSSAFHKQKFSHHKDNKLLTLQFRITDVLNDYYSSWLNAQETCVCV